MQGSLPNTKTVSTVSFFFHYIFFRVYKNNTFCVFPPQENNNPVIEAVFAHVLPGSTLVTSQQLYNDLCMIKNMSDVVSVEALMKLDPPENQQSLVNLGKN